MMRMRLNGEFALSAPAANTRKRAHGQSHGIVFLAALIGLMCPNTAQAQDRPQLLRDDPRLTVSIKVQAEGIPLSDLLAQITARAGVTLTADEEAGDDKIIVLGPARPLYAILGDVAALFGDVWMTSRAPDGAARYRLIRSARTRRQENLLLSQSKARMMEALSRQAAALSETPDQLKQRPAHDPIRARLSEPDGRTATAFYALLTAPQQQQLFDTGSTDSFPFAALTPQQQQPLREWFARYTAPIQEQANKFNDNHLVIAVPRPEDLQRGTVRFLITGGGSRDTEISLQIGKSSLSLRRFSSDLRALLPPRGNPYTGQAVPPHTKLPIIKQVDAAAGTGEWRDQLHQLADTAQVPVMADYYRSVAADVIAPPPSAHADAPSRPDADALDAFCRPQSCLWWISGQTLLLRKREWYVVRQYETPDRWTREMADSLNAHGGKPTYEDLLRLDQLTPLQIAGQNLARGVADTHLDSVPSLLAIIRACALNPHNTLPGQPYMLPDTHPGATPNTYLTINPSAKEALICAVPMGADLLHRYVLHLPASPTDLSGVRITLFYSYPYQQDARSTTPHALEEAQKHLEELSSGDAADTEEYRRRLQEMIRLQAQEQMELLTKNKADGKFVYVNITSSLAQKSEDLASPQVSSPYEIPVGHSFSYGSTINMADLTPFPVSFHYHVVLPRTLIDDRSDRTQIKVMP